MSKQVLTPSNLNPADFDIGGTTPNKISMRLDNKSITAAGLATGGGALSTTPTITVTPATEAEAIAGTRDDVALTPKAGKAALDDLHARILNASPATLDTLAEIAAALGNDPNLATTLTNLIANETAARQAADANEQAARIAGDNSEATARQAAIANEAAIRALNDSAEQSARSAGDSALQTQINTLNGTITPQVRRVDTAFPLQGGGDLSTDRMLNLVFATLAETIAQNRSDVPVSPATLYGAINALRQEILNASPAQLDTLAEIATALGNDPNFAATITAAVAQKVPMLRIINTSAPLQGGGSLNADLTITLDMPALIAVLDGTFATDAALAAEASSRAAADNAILAILKTAQIYD